MKKQNPPCEKQGGKHSENMNTCFYSRCYSLCIHFTIKGAFCQHFFVSRLADAAGGIAVFDQLFPGAFEDLLVVFAYLAYRRAIGIVKLL